MQEDRHQQDIDFLEELKGMTLYELHLTLQFQACEVWKQIAVDREIARRKAAMKQIMEEAKDPND